MMAVNRVAAPNPTAQQHHLDLDGLRFRYWRWGNSGPAIVLVHATGFHGYVWKPIAQALACGAQVVALDQRGHGDSAKPETGYAWDVFARDLHGFLIALGLQGADAVGHSAGATAIARCAALHPGLIRRAVLIDPILYPRPAEGQVVDNPLAHRARKRRMVWESRTGIFHSYRVRPPFNTWCEEALWAYIEEGTNLRTDGHVELKCPGAIEAQVFDNASTSGGFAVLPQVDTPVLLLRGAASDAFSHASAEYALSLLPHADLQVIAGTTHFLPMEEPALVAAAIRQFFSLPLGVGEAR